MLDEVRYLSRQAGYSFVLIHPSEANLKRLQELGEDLTALTLRCPPMRERGDGAVFERLQQNPMPLDDIPDQMPLPFVPLKPSLCYQFAGRSIVEEL